MQSPFRTALLIGLTFLWIVAQPVQDAGAKGPKGKSGVRGGWKSQSSFHGGSHGGGYATHGGYSGGGQGQMSHQTTGAGHYSTVDSGSEGHHPWSMQRANEEQKLNHRLGVADKLDGIAERNGNPNLHAAAERKREKAQQLYEKRMTKIDGKDPIPETGDDLEDLPDPPSEPTGDLVEIVDPFASDPIDEPGDSDPIDDALTTARKLTGRENALDRQLRNEQRKLTQRMEMAERLRKASEQTEDKQLADLARALEDRALAQYTERMDAIRAFQDRHGLPDRVGDGLPPVDPLAGSPGGQSDTLGEAVGTLIDMLVY